MILILLRGSIPGWMSFELSNMLVMTGALMGLKGLEHFFQKKSPQRYNILFLAAFAVFYIYFLEVVPNLELRNLAISVGLLVLSFQCVWLTVKRVTLSEQRMAKLVTFVFGGFCLVSLLRIWIILALPIKSNDFFQSGLYDTLILLSYQILLILLTFSLVLMVNERLKNEIQIDEEKYSKAFQSSPYAITFTRAIDGRILEVNEGFQSITGYMAAEAIGKTTQELQLWVNAEDRSTVISELAKGNSVRSKEFLFRKRNGNIVNGLFSADTIMLNEQPWILSSIEDITDRKKTETRIREYSEHLEEMVDKRTSELKISQGKLARQERLAVLGQLAGSVGHELRSPLGVMANAIYFLKLSQPEAEPKIKEYHEILQSEVNNADKIISDLLDFSRIKNVDRKDFSTKEICEQVLLRYPIPKNIQFHNEIPTNLPKIFADPQQIAQVLGNLVLNAYQSMTEGGDMTISAETEGKHVKISVRDTGIGIPKENIDQLFDPLFTTKSRGIGLGLTVSKMLMKANDGKIEVSSDVGKGSIFSMYLPFRKGKR